MKSDIDKINEQIDSIQNMEADGNLEQQPIETEVEQSLPEENNFVEEVQPVEEVSHIEENNSVASETLESEDPFANQKVKKKNPIKDLWQKFKDKYNREKNFRAWVTIGAFVFVLFLGLLYFAPNGVSILKSNGKSFRITNVEKSSTGSYANSNESFVIYTEGGSLDDVRKHIYVEPAINYQIEQKGKNQYRLITTDIPSDKLININFVDNQVVEDKWAFQSTKDLKVNSIYPADGSKGVSAYSNIEITFSYYDLENVQDYIEITPAVDGTFEHNGRTWTLRQKTPLQENTVYTIRVKEGLPYGNEKLAESVQTTFSTFQASTSKNTTNIGYDSITIDNIETFRPVDTPMFRTRSTRAITRVEVFKVKGSNEFKKMLDKQDYAADSIGDISFHKIDEEGNTSSSLYTFENPLEKGYYVVKGYTDDGDLFFTMPMQVNDLSAYLLNTQSDLLVWVGSDNTLLKDIPVTYEGKTVKTDKDGLAFFKDYNSLDESIKYITVGNDDPIFIGVKTQSNEMYANGYVYVDRPLYKNTDDIKIWGYIPFDFYKEWGDFSKDNFVLSFNDETIPIKVSSNGTFMTSYHLDNYKDGYFAIHLKYKNKIVASHSLEVLQYEKNNYSFKINKDRDYVYAGENYHFTVEVKHISGVYVPNKEIRVTVGGVLEYTATTDNNGVASFDIPTAIDPTATPSSTIYKSMLIKSSLTDYAQKGINSSFNVINRFVGSDYTANDYDREKKEMSLTIKEYPENPVGKTLKDLESAQTPYSGSIRYVLKESKSVRRQVGTRYNEFTKENVPEYVWDNSSQDVIASTAEVKDGKAVLKLDYDYIKSTKDITYSYYLNAYVKDRKGNELTITRWISPFVKTTAGGSFGHLDYGYGTGYCGGTGSSADLYSYYFAKENTSSVYSVGDQLTRELYHYTNTKEENGQPILFVRYKNHILDKEIQNYTDNITIPFEDDYRPNIRMTAAYFKNGVFYRMPVETIINKKEDNELAVDIQPEKKTYKPGDKVKVKINVSKNGKGVKSAINVSVVDEGVFNDTQDYTPILSNIYTTKYYYQYTYSTYRDYTFYNNGGGCGGTSGPTRENFGDTVYFDTVETDRNGNATVEFTLNDSITSFRITVHATTDDADVGVNHTNIESSLPVSITFTEPRGLKVSDDVVLSAYGIGSSKENVHYEFAIEGVDNKVEKDAVIGQTVYASFGKLPAGEYKATITATSANETDKVKFSFRVVNSQMEVFVRNTFSINDQSKIKPTKNPIILELYRETFKDYETFLNIIADTKEERMDTRLSYAKALFYENRYLEEKNNVEIGDVSAFRGDKGWKFLNAEEVSYPLTAVVSYYDKDLRFDKNIYYEMTKSDQANERLHGYLVLSSMKEPVLDDIRFLFNKFSTYDDEVKEELILSALFLGDYKTVRKYYTELPDNQGLKTYLSTYVYKNNSNEMIKKLHTADVANRYLYFSIVSYFENNHVDLDTKEKVTVSYGKEKKEVELLPIGKKKLTIYQNNLKDLKIDSKYKDIYYNYYYEGAFDEIDESLKDNVIGIRLDNENPSVGDTVNLVINVSGIPKNTSIKVYLPNGLRVSGKSVSQGAYIATNRTEYFTVYVSNSAGNEVTVPLYVSSPGEYLIEPIVMKTDDGRYKTSNSLTVHIQ